MIDAVNVPAQTVAANGDILFGNTRICTGCTVRHEQGSGRFVLTKPGVYEVSFSANVSIPTGGTLTAIAVNIQQDGDELAGTRMTTTPTAVATPHNISTTVLARVYCDCCSSISVGNVGTGSITVDNANLVITREC